MSIDLAFTPSGRIIGFERAEGERDSSESSVAAALDGRVNKVANAFASSQAEGLFALASERFEVPLGPSLSYWRDFAGRYLTELCHTPEGTDDQIEAIPPPDASELATMNEKLGELTTRSCNMLEPLVVLMGRLERMMD